MTPIKRILLDSTHFIEIRNSIRSRSVAWVALARSSEISEIDASIAKKLETILIKKKRANDEDYRMELENLDVTDEIMTSLIHLLANCENFDVLKSVQNLLAELLSCEYGTVAYKTINYFQRNPDQLVELFNLTFNDDNSEKLFDIQMVLISSFNVVSLLIQNDLRNDDLVKKLLNNENCLNILQNVERMDTCYITIRLLQELSIINSYKTIIWENESKILPTIFQIIKRSIRSSPGNTSNMRNEPNTDSSVMINTNSNNLGIQLQYYSLLFVWLLTFNNKIASEIIKRYLNEFLNLLKIIKVTIKEKISRISVSIVLQCCEPQIRGSKEFIKNLILLGNGITTLDNLIERKYSDEELKDDLIKLKEILDNEYRELTSFDEYIAELDSKLIVWSPPHIDSDFWINNIDKFKEHNWKLFEKLINLLSEFKDLNSGTKNDNVIIQILLNDITHVIDLLPEESIAVLNKLNGKVIIMELLNHNDSRIKFEALKATQAMIGYKFK
ncbi:hypothetical protein KAFR_0K02170 [Kazachstania africana CBS 2517]|uniref:V-type proton ATPase subunit H n=1 Tax=Kazachstania africana (strain ATCC 22294 / BCRC 22015 / CBS 2517 / CECT 1963 / NBRC 1671 / NRRL Y-8276) TaxID=1071382 RepID=H2B1S1_KAZAF|nr:hypothetical protein KAFR_0K02170 [Kazachstania africana CBS 2517]CCF60571.1 hypothetical protein KAFR_0K02170 [Kazachstania africana CBS 2517]